MASILNEKSIVNQRKVFEVPENTVILREGEQNLDMYKIVSGHAEMYMGYGTDSEVLVGIIGPGACFGEFGVLTRQPAIYTIVTYTKVKILRINESLMEKFIAEDPQSALQIMQNMAGSMIRMQNQINQLSQELSEINVDIAPKTNIIRREIRQYAVNSSKDQSKQASKPTEGAMKFLSRRHQ